LISTHHFRKTLFVVLQVDKIAIAELLAPIRHFFGQDMSMTIDLKHVDLTAGRGIDLE